MKEKDVFASIDKVLLGIIKWICVACFVFIMLLVTVYVFLRFVPITSINWYNEIIELCFGWMIFYGAAAVWITKGHFSAGDWIERRIKSPRMKASYRLMVEIISFVFIAVFFWYSLQLCNQSIEVTESIQFPKKVIYSSMPISSGIMVLYSIKFIVLNIIKIAKSEKIEEVQDKA